MWKKTRDGISYTLIVHYSAFKMNTELFILSLSLGSRFVQGTKMSL